MTTARNRARAARRHAAVAEAKAALLAYDGEGADVEPDLDTIADDHLRLIAAATREDVSQGGALRSRLTCSWMEKSTTRPSPDSLPVTRALEAAMHFPRRSSQQPSLTAP